VLQLNCLHIDQIFFSFIQSKAFHLISLSLIECHHVDSPCLHLIADSLFAPNLIALKFFAYNRLTDSGIAYLVSKCPKLECFELKDENKKIPEKFLNTFKALVDNKIQVFFSPAHSFI